MRTVITLLLLAGCWSGVAHAESGHSFDVRPKRELSVAEYLAELDHISALAAEAGEKPEAREEAMAELRGGWVVVANGQKFTVASDAISQQFEQLRNGSRGESREWLLRRLQALRSDALAFEKTPADPAPARALLNDILVRREFHHAQGDSWFERLKYQMLTWIVRLLARVLGSSSVPTVGTIFVWALVVAAVSVLAVVAYRTIGRGARLASVIPPLAPEQAKRWSAWMVEAQAAAAEGLWREAVHGAYWAGISFLEENGMWKPDQTRTPREYISLLPAASEYRATLLALTRQLELTWYGNQRADRDTFSETLGLLEKLGCQPA